MADNNTEQQSLPASEKKLRDARRKGRVPRSADLITGFGFFATLAYLFLTWPTIRDRIIELIDLVSGMTNQPFAVAWRAAITLSAEVVWLTIAPIIAVAVLVSVVVGMAGTRGPVFSFESIKPNFDHINPAEGAKRIFSIRNVMEFLKTFLKVVLLAGVLFLVLRFWLQAMFHAPNCGEACVVPLLLAAAKPILGVAVIAFILIGLADVALQRWLFLRDMRMTRTEAKREHKDLEGDPLILGARKRDRQQQSRAPRLGLSAANVVITGGEYVAGLRYHRKDVPVPVIVIRASGEEVKAILAAARESDIPISLDTVLARELVQQHRPGDHVHQKHFPMVARILVAQRLV